MNVKMLRITPPVQDGRFLIYYADKYVTSSEKVQHTYISVSLTLHIKITTDDNHPNLQSSHTTSKENGKGMNNPVKGYRLYFTYRHRDFTYTVKHPDKAIPVLTEAMP